jgi:hypothetical protein
MFATVFGVMLSQGAAFIIRTFTDYLRVTIQPAFLLMYQYEMLGIAILGISMLGIFQALILARRNRRGVLWVPASFIGILGCFGIAALNPFWATPLSLCLLSFFRLEIGNYLWGFDSHPAAMDSALRIDAAGRTEIRQAGFLGYLVRLPTSIASVLQVRQQDIVRPGNPKPRELRDGCRIASIPLQKGDVPDGNARRPDIIHRERCQMRRYRCGHP